MYIVSSHMANGEKCEWLIAKTNPEMIIKMLSDEATIRGMFTVNDTIDIVTQCAGETNVSIRTVRFVMYLQAFYQPKMNIWNQMRANSMKK